jgi:diaminopimelate decarboxylase
MDAVSLGDLHLMKKAGFPMEHVVLHGNTNPVMIICLPLKIMSEPLLLTI